ncbi:Uncharacterized protein TPAR_06277 [Tolypocladium paradoxum]|uniref:Diacylglycerol O-acyltransferase n=1 Tax=Tolypocladium paradoxum TaxID=94208 RepID=A0A2S4KTL8_9HYPO|nr:Uncharacterized protein TPAR_06277 [Tolypocladium paradoxum]
MAATNSSHQAATGPQKPRVIRKLGNIELLHAALHALDQYAGTGVACHYVVPEHLAAVARRDELQQTLDLAIARTVRQHPVLRVGILREDSRKPAFIELDTVDLGQQVEWHVVGAPQDYDTNSRAILNRLIDGKYSDLETRPSWNIALVRRDGARTLEVMFVWHHAIADGMSGKIFHETLLQHLNAPKGTDDEALLKNRVLKVSGSAHNFPPPMEKMVKYPFSIGLAVSTIYNMLKPSKHQETQAMWAPIRAGPCKTELRRITVADSTLQMVLIACRRHKTTLTGLLHGIILVSMASQLLQQQAPGFVGRTPINMRAFTPPSPPEYPKLQPAETMANIVSVTDHEFDVDLVAYVRNQIQRASAETDGRSTLAEVIWSSATTARHEIRKAVDLGVKDNPVGLMCLVPDWREHNKSDAKKPRHLSWVVTNLGVLDGAANVDGAEKDAGAWSVERASFSTSAQVTGPAIGVCPIAVKGGKLCLDFCWQVGVVDTALGERLASSVEDWLAYLGTKDEGACEVTQ